MNIILCSAEISPLAKTGGLADVCYYLPKEWKKLGHNPIVILPKYGFIDTEKYNLKPTLITLNVPMGHNTEFARLWSGFLPDSDVPLYLVEYEQYFNRKEIYGETNEYVDNDRRFIFISRAVFEVAKAIDFTPDIIHAHDYHLAFTMPFLKIYYNKEERFKNTSGVFTIHNLAYQGKFNQYRVMDYAGFGMKEFFPGSWFEHQGVCNFIKTGIMFADKVSTVSPNYANEIKNAYYGEGLYNVLSEKAADLVGILNGVDYDLWNSNEDDLIYQKYNTSDLSIKEVNKIELLKAMQIDPYKESELPLVGIVSRLTEQKGIDIIKDSLIKNLEKRKFKFILLGNGENQYIDFFNYLKHRFPDLVSIYIGYDNELSHKVIAGSDILLVPSRFEPCGLTQLYALKYGTLPLARATGGLVDTVVEYSYEFQTGDGIVFNNYNTEDFDYAIQRAINLYNDKFHLEKVRQNAMKKDYSANSSAQKYIELFNWAKEKLG